MTISATYASDLSRVRVACSSIPAAADHVVIERSVDQIRWVTVRGGAKVLIAASACALDDYEFVPGQVNYYRARYVDMADPAVMTAGTLSTGNNASVTPGLPAGVAENDVLVMTVAIRNTAATINTPAGWNLLVNGGNVKVFTRAWTSGVAAPTVTFSGGASGDDTLARMVNIRNADFTVIATAMQSNASNQNIGIPAIGTAALTPNLLALIAWKQSTATGASRAGWFLMFNDVATAGNDEFVAMFGKTTSDAQIADNLIVTGGSAAISKACALRFTRKPYISQETANVTPTLNSVWLKNIEQPFLNRSVTPTDFTEIEQPSRSGAFNIVSRSLAVAVTELRGGNQFSLTLKTETNSQSEDLRAVLSGGKVVLLHLPHDFRMFPGGYYLIGNLKTRRAQSVYGERRYHDLPLTQVAAPSDVVVGTTVTWQNVISSFATWADVIAAEATWADVMDRIGTPADVVVP